MKDYVLGGLVAAFLVIGTGTAAAENPPLAPGVEAAPDFKPTHERYVVTNGTPLYRGPHWTPGETTGRMLERGQRPQILGEANLGLFLLVGEKGQGVGYAPRSLFCPVELCSGKES